MIIKLKKIDDIMKKILITGGACAGKTMALKVVKDYLEGKGYTVSIFEEVPTNLINQD